MDWRTFWDDFPKRFEETDFCKQVARTAGGGIPADRAEIDLVYSEVASRAALKPSDRVLDLCCGNGMLTARMGSQCERVFGIDFSEPLINVARSHHKADNVSYQQASALELDQVTWPEPPNVNKVCMVESLQYFEPAQFPVLLSSIASTIASSAGNEVTLYFSGVLDRDRIWNFFNTPERRAAYEQRMREGKPIMGNWWLAEDIKAMAAQAGFTTEILVQNEKLNTAHYRFDVRLNSR